VKRAGEDGAGSAVIVRMVMVIPSVWV